MRISLYKYGTLLREFFRACLVEEVEYRANFAANVVMTLFQTLISIMTVQLFFYRTNEIGGWSFFEVLVLLGLFQSMQGFIAFFLQPNMSRLVSHIRQGTLDFVLLKPVDSQFYVSFRHLVFWRLADIAIGLGIAGYSLIRLGTWPGLEGWLLFGLLLGSAMVIVYSLWMAMMTFSFWAVKVDNLSFLFTSMFETARFPVTVYRGFLRLLLTYVFPVALITTYPAGALAGRVGWGEAAAGLLLAAVFFTLSRMFWRFALRHYSSASS